MHYSLMGKMRLYFNWSKGSKFDLKKKKRNKNQDWAV